MTNFVVTVHKVDDFKGLELNFYIFNYEQQIKMYMYSVMKIPLQSSIVDYVKIIH